MGPALAQVEDYGRVGIAGLNTVPLLSGDTLDRLEGFAGGEFLCNRADQEEFNYINSCGGYEYQTTQAITDFDAANEELIFLEAARRSHEFTTCQLGLFNSYANDTQTRATLFENARLQFQQVLPRMHSILAEKEVEENKMRISAAAMFGARAEPMPDFATQNQRYNEASAKSQRIKTELDMMVSRIPLGNRKEVRDQIFELARGSATYNAATFNGAFAAGIGKLHEQALQSSNFFNSIYSNRNGNALYLVKENLKKTLVRTGQIENVLRMHGMDQRLARGFMCRAQARYDDGPRNLAIAEIPLYFVGAYGLGRLAIRSGVGAIRAASAASRTAQAVQWSARGAVLGMEGWQYARLADDIQQGCWPQEFIASVQTTTCSAESEIKGVYQEASIAQCLSSAVLGLAPIAMVGGARVWQGVRRAADQIPITVDEIVVVAPRPLAQGTLNLVPEMSAFLGTRPSLLRRVNENPQMFRRLAENATEETELLRVLNDDPRNVSAFERFLNSTKHSTMTPEEARRLRANMEALYRRQCTL